MGRKAILTVVIVLLAALAAWRSGLLGPLFSTADAPVPEGEARSLAEVADGASKAPVPATLASGGKKPVARSKAPVDGPRITGKVTDRAGKGIADARVVSIPDTSKEAFRLEQIGSDGCPGADAITDADGKFVVPVSNDAPYHALAATVAGYGVALETGARPGVDVTLVLDRNASISGHVMDAEGAGIVGARISVHVLFDALSFERSEMSGVGGAYQIVDLPSSPKSPLPARAGVTSCVEVTADGYAPLLASGISTLRPGVETTRDFVLGRGAVVVGKVVDADSGDPIEGARVALWSQEGEARFSWYRNLETQLQIPWIPRVLAETRSTKDGSFEFEHVPAQGFHPLLAMSYGRKGPIFGYVGALKEGTCGTAEEISFGKEGARLEVTLKLWPAARVEGRVVDTAGKPVTKAMVETAVKERPLSGWLPKSVFGETPTQWTYEGTGADGSYRLTGIPVPRKGATDVEVRGRWGRSGQSWDANDGGNGSVTVTLSAGTTVTAPDLVLAPEDPNRPSQANVVETQVRVVSSAGAPVWGANLNLNYSNLAQTDREGKAVLVWTKPASPQSGAPTLAVRARGFAPAFTSLEAAATSTDTLSVTLQSPHRLTGHVLDSDGAPVPALVSVGNGSLPFEEVFPGPSAQGRVGAPSAGSSRGLSFPPPPANFMTDAEGRFVAEDLPEGPYHLIATRQRAVSAPGTKAAPRGTLNSVGTDAAEILITMPPDPNPPTGALEGTVVDAVTGRPVFGLKVTLRRGDEIFGTASSKTGGVALEFAGTNAGGPSIPSPGRYEFPDVPSGTWTVVAVGDGYTRMTLDGVAIRAGEITKAPVVSLDRGVTVKGLLSFPEGVSLADRVLSFTETTAEPGKERWISASVSADASYSVSGFTPGLWRISCTKQSYEGRREPVLLTAHSEKVQVSEGDSEVHFDATLVVAGTLAVQPQDDRLPPPNWENVPATDAQKAFSDGCRVVVRAADGTVIAEQSGKIQRNGAGRVSFLSVLPGRYTVRLEMPGNEVREETVEVVAGSPTTVTLAKK